MRGNCVEEVTETHKDNLGDLNINLKNYIKMGISQRTKKWACGVVKR
jgi:hypothetical protein